MDMITHGSQLLIVSETPFIRECLSRQNQDKNLKRAKINKTSMPQPLEVSQLVRVSFFGSRMIVDSDVHYLGSSITLQNTKEICKAYS